MIKGVIIKGLSNTLLKCGKVIFVNNNYQNLIYFNKYSWSRILITGALGNIGSRFIHSLFSGEFDEVLMIDNISFQLYTSLFSLPENVNFIDSNILKADFGHILSGYWCYSPVSIVFLEQHVTDHRGL